MQVLSAGSLIFSQFFCCRKLSFKKKNFLHFTVVIGTFFGTFTTLEAIKIPRFVLKLLAKGGVGAWGIVKPQYMGPLLCVTLFSPGNLVAPESSNRGPPLMTPRGH